MLLQHAREWHPQPLIQAVVWDMGGVFRRYFTELMIDTGHEQGWPLDRLPLGPTGQLPDPDYQAMSDGIITEPQYLDRLREKLRKEGIEYDPVTDPKWSNAERPATWEAIRLIADSPIIQAILTNDASVWMGEGWWETWPAARYFDAIVDVATLDQRKPDPEPYREVIRRIDLPPRHCIFVDDMAVNCRGAEAVGMASLFFDVKAPEESIERLLQRIGLTQ